MAAKCPQCKGPVAKAAPSRPFCSERCRLLDLGAWLDGRYVIAGTPVDEGDEAGSPKPESDDETLQ